MDKEHERSLTTRGKIESRLKRQVVLLDSNNSHIFGVIVGGKDELFRFTVETCTCDEDHCKMCQDIGLGPIDIDKEPLIRIPKGTYLGNRDTSRTKWIRR